jgi:hypothetical protein
MFAPAPPPLKALMRRAIVALQAMESLRAHRLGHRPDPPAAALRIRAAGSAGGFEADPESQRQASEEAVVRDAELWEGDGEVAFITAMYDPPAGGRRVMACNRATAELLGMHREELLARFAARELDVPCLDVDWLANFLHELEFPAEVRGERFVRMAVRRGPGEGAGRRGLLVRHLRVKVFDGAGTVVRVRARSSTAPRPLHPSSSRLHP